MNTMMRKVSVVSVLWLVASQANAEMKMIEDDALAVVTGQKGLTIDMAFGLDIGEFMYQDAGSVAVQGFRMGGMDRTGSTLVGGVRVGGEVGTKYNGKEAIDTQDPGPIVGSGSNTSGGSNLMNNIRIKVDIAGDGSQLDNNGYVPSGVFGGGVNPVPDNVFNWAWGGYVSGLGGGATACGDFATNELVCGYVANDGDLIIHAEPINPNETDNGRPHTIADFGIEIDAFKIKGVNYVAGDDISFSEDSTAQSTTIFSNFKMEGYFGGFDMLLENKGNSFGTYDGEFGSKGNFTATGTGYAASKIKINTFFEVTEMEYDFNIAGLRIEGMSIHNFRGDKSMFDFLTQDSYPVGPFVATSQGYAQSNTQIFAVNETVINAGELFTGGSGYVDGIAMFNRFRGDMDIAHMSFGDTGTSIGSQYWTDIDLYSNMIISAH